jgi:hypothetical protein
MPASFSIEFVLVHYTESPIKIIEEKSFLKFTLTISGSMICLQMIIESPNSYASEHIIFEAIKLL